MSFCWPRWKRVPLLHIGWSPVFIVAVLFYIFPYSFITLHVNSFPLESLSHYLNNDSLFSLSLPFMPSANGLSHSSETIFSAKQSQGHTAVLLQTRLWVWGSWNSWAAGYLGSSWQPRAPFPGLKSSLLIPRVEILHGHLNAPFGAWAARTEPQGPEWGQAQSHSSILCPSTRGRAWQRPSHHKRGDTASETFPKGKDITMSSRLRCVEWGRMCCSHWGAAATEHPWGRQLLPGCISVKEKGRKKKGWVLPEFQNNSWEFALRSAALSLTAPSLHLQRKLLL